jgi:hypothetical protein
VLLSLREGKPWHPTQPTNVLLSLCDGKPWHPTQPTNVLRSYHDMKKYTQQRIVRASRLLFPWW